MEENFTLVSFTIVRTDSMVLAHYSYYKTTVAFKKMKNYIGCFDLVKNELEERQATDTYLLMLTNSCSQSVLSYILQRVFDAAHFIKIADLTFKYFDNCN